MTDHIVNIPTPLFIDSESSGDIDVIKEVIEQDCYGLRALYESGFRPNVIVDVGAHIGTFSVLAHSYFPKSDILCIEPNPKLSHRLFENVYTFAYLSYSGVVYDKQENCLIESVGATGGSFLTSGRNKESQISRKHIHDGFMYNETSDLFPSCSLESILKDNKFHSIDLLKLDCEGGEWGIAEHLSDEIAKTVKVIKGEYHTFNGRALEEFKSLVEKKFPHMDFTFNKISTHGLFEAYAKSL